MGTTELTLTVEDVLDDLEAGRSRPFRGVASSTVLPGVRRPALGGPAFLATAAAARVATQARPALARSLYGRLWFTPWVHPTAARPVVDLPPGATAWEAVVAGHRLAGWTAGAGPTVVLVHGWSGRSTDLRAIGRDLVASGHRVVAPDLPAHGLSSGRQTDLVEMADVLAVVLRREGPVHAVVAHSMGLPTTVLALQGGPLPSRIVGIASGRRLSGGIDAVSARGDMDAAQRALLEEAVADRLGDDALERFVVDRDVSQLRMPTLLVHDGDDDEVPFAEAEAIAAAWPTARLVRTDGLGHRRILVDGDVREAVVAHVAA